MMTTTETANQASMRPRLITAENKRPHVACRRSGGASMRPRLITAENIRRRPGRPPRAARFNEAAAHHRGERAPREPAAPRPPCRFNEAAAHHRGERLPDAAAPLTETASMRPRLITAENVYCCTAGTYPTPLQ